MCSCIWHRQTHPLISRRRWNNWHLAVFHGFIWGDEVISSTSFSLLLPKSLAQWYITERKAQTINLPVNLWGNLSIIHRSCSLFFALDHLHNGCYCLLSQSFLSPGPAFSLSSAGTEQKTRALTHIFQETLGQLWLQMFACDGSHWMWCAWHMEAIRSHLGYKGQDALCCSSQILTAASGVWCCGVLRYQSPGDPMGTADGAQHEPPNWLLLLDWAAPWQVLRVPLSPRKKIRIWHICHNWVDPVFAWDL